LLEMAGDRVGNEPGSDGIHVPVAMPYKVSEKLVTVVYGSGIKTARLGILPAEMLAHMLLRELEFERRETKRNTLGE